MTMSIQKDALLSQFSVLAYKDEAFLNNSANLPSGWKLVDSEIKPPFAAFAFQNESTGEVFVAYRGTDGLGDASADARIFAGKWDSQFQQGMDFLARTTINIELFPGGFDKSQLLVTGHSLGGAIAQVVAYAYGLDGSTIDPGAAQRIVGTSEFQAAAMAAGLQAQNFGVASSFTNYLVAGSMVSGGTGPHLGQESYVASLNFASQSAIAAFLIGLVNPIAGIAYAIGTDQFANKHSSEQVSQALQLMAGAGDAGTVGSDAFVLKPKITGWQWNEERNENMPRYSQTEFEIHNKDGELQNTVKFSGSGSDRQFEVFDSTGALKSTTILSSSGAVTVQPVVGDSVVVAYLPESNPNEDGTITVTRRSPDGKTTSIANSTTYEDGSTSETANYADGRIIRTNTDGAGTITSTASIQVYPEGWLPRRTGHLPRQPHRAPGL